MHRGFGFALFIVVSFANTAQDTVYEQFISSVFFWRAAGQSGVDSRERLDGDYEEQGKLWEMVQSDL